MRPLDVIARRIGDLARYCEQAIRTLFAEPRLSGLAIWQTFDSCSFVTGPALRKARGFNGGGILDQYRQPKLSYRVVKTAYADAATARG